MYEGSKYLGKAIQYPTCFMPHIEVWDEKDNKLYDVNGPCLVCCSDTEYPVNNISIKNYRAQLVGIIVKHVSLNTSLLTVTSYFRFPIRVEMRWEPLLGSGTVAQNKHLRTQILLALDFLLALTYNNVL